MSLNHTPVGRIELANDNATSIYPGKIWDRKEDPQDLLAKILTLCEAAPYVGESCALEELADGRVNAVADTLDEIASLCIQALAPDRLAKQEAEQLEVQQRWQQFMNQLRERKQRAGTLGQVARMEENHEQNTR